MPLMTCSRRASPLSGKLLVHLVLLTVAACPTAGTPVGGGNGTHRGTAAMATRTTWEGRARQIPSRVVAIPEERGPGRHLLLRKTAPGAREGRAGDRSPIRGRGGSCDASRRARAAGPLVGR